MSRAAEKKFLRPLLENYSYEKFNEDMAQWMKSGRYVWYITGNITSDEAIQIVEKTRETMGLNNLPVEQIGELNPMALKVGTATLLDMPLEDKTNENSCTLTYYEIGTIKGDYRQNYINEVMMQWLNEPFFDDLRTKQQLGYVVFSRSYNTRDVLGC